MPRRAPRHQSGRRGLLNPERAQQLVSLIALGNYATTAAAATGISRNTFWNWLRPHPAAHKRYITIQSRPGFTATHESAQLATPIARAVFWRPFDALLARVRAAPTP